MAKQNKWGLDNENDYPQIKNVFNALDPVPVPEESLDALLLMMMMMTPIPENNSVIANKVAKNNFFTLFI
jgi:hypothetical protein